MNERLETAKKLTDISAKMREVCGDILSVYESHEISYNELGQFIDAAQKIMDISSAKAFEIYDDIVLG